MSKITFNSLKYFRLFLYGKISKEEFSAAPSGYDIETGEDMSCPYRDNDPIEQLTGHDIEELVLSIPARKWKFLRYKDVNTWTELRQSPNKSVLWTGDYSLRIL